jgi:branched-chain amino acid aminotransferase
MSINITQNPNSRFNSIDWNKLGFGKYFSDHVYMADFDGNSWDEGAIIPYSTMEVEPALCTLHYGQTIFEGLKAFYDVNGGANIFRGDKNADRLNNSAEILCIPEFPKEKFIEAVTELVRLDNKFVPRIIGQSLYIRPVLYGTGNFLGVQTSDTYKLIIITSPVASYYAEGLAPLKILVSSDHFRTTVGGLGMAKTAANYAASLHAGRDAKKQGFSQVLWLDSVTKDVIDEVGAMNIVFVIDNEVITPTLEQGTLLNGVTRRTVLELAQEMGYKTTERRITITEVYEAHKKGTLQEVFGTGTAAVISPVGTLSWKGNEITINDNQIGPIAQKMYDTIVGLQHGQIEDTRNWNIKVKY